MKHDQLQLTNDALQQQVVTEHSQLAASNDKQHQGATVSKTKDQSVPATTEGHQVMEGGKQKRINFSSENFFIVLFFIDIGPEIPFEIGQFLLYKGHFLNLLHFPIWKVHTKTLLLKYDTVLADSEIAWEATDEVRIDKCCISIEIQNILIM